MLKISSPAFSDGGPIPRAHTCDGADLSPPLSIVGVPEGTKELALIVDDPDAPGGVWVHWVIYRLPATTHALPAGFPKEGETGKPIPARQGTNDFRKIGWGGPCPPKGPAHRYAFTLFALNAELTTPAGATKSVLLAAMQGKVIEEATLVGRYGR
jgi:Raf kinase inhibitor-like YbhB/YbcL family protein